MIAFKALLISAFFSVLCVLLISKAEYKVLGVALSASMSAFYLLFANVKEFGFKNFFALFSLKIFAFMLLFLSIFSFILIEFKAQIIFAFEILGNFFKDLAFAVF